MKEVTNQIKNFEKLVSQLGIVENKISNHLEEMKKANEGLTKNVENFENLKNEINVVFNSNSLQAKYLKKLVNEFERKEKSDSCRKIWIIGFFIIVILFGLLFLPVSPVYQYTRKQCIENNMKEEMYVTKDDIESLKKQINDLEKAIYKSTENVSVNLTNNQIPLTK